MRTQHLSVCVEDPRTFWEPAQVRSTRGPKWLRRLVVALVKRFGIETGVARPVRAYEVATGEDFLTRLNLAQKDMRRVHDKETKYLLVGPDSWPDLAREIHDRATMFAMPLEFRSMRPESGRIVVLGITVVLVPWMSGALPLPDIEKMAGVTESAKPG